MPKKSQIAVDLERTATAPITEGVHTFSVTEISEGQKLGPDGEPVSGSYPYWRVTCAVQDGPEASKTTDLILSLSPAARWRMELFLDAVKAPAKGTATPDKFIGRTFRGKVEHEDFQGRPQARINEMFAVSAGGNAKTASPAVVVAAGKKQADDPIAEVAQEDPEETE